MVLTPEGFGFDFTFDRDSFEGTAVICFSLESLDWPIGYCWVFPVDGAAACY